jgi:hypothetical protein
VTAIICSRSDCRAAPPDCQIARFEEQADEGDRQSSRRGVGCPWVCIQEFYNQTNNGENIVRAAMCWAAALDIPRFGSESVQNTLLGDIKYRLVHTANTGIDPTGWDYVTDRSGPVDPRYCYQPTFA